MGEYFAKRSQSSVFQRLRPARELSGCAVVTIVDGAIGSFSTQRMLGMIGDGGIREARYEPREVVAPLRRLVDRWVCIERSRGGSWNSIRRQEFVVVKIARRRVERRDLSTRLPVGGKHGHHVAGRARYKIHRRVSLVFEDVGVVGAREDEADEQQYSTASAFKRRRSGVYDALK